MGYKAAARLKMGDDKGDFERGDKVTAKDVGGKKELERLVSQNVVLEDGDFAVAFPELKEGANQPTGTPSNLEPVEGTDLEAGGEGSEAPEEASDEEDK